MIKINLLREPSAKKASRGLGVSKPMIILLASAATLLVFLVGFYIYTAGQLEEVKTEIAELQQQKMRLRRVQAQIQRSERQQAQLEERISLINRLKSNQRGPVILMNGVLASVPEEPKLWLTNLVQRNNNVVVEGRAFNVPAIADFISDLGRTKPFGAVDIEFWEEQPNDVRFKLNCRTKN